MPQMTYAQLIKFFGTQAEAARKLAVPQTTVSAWKRSFPHWRQSQVESATDGKLKANGK